VDFAPDVALLVSLLLGRLLLLHDAVSSARAHPYQGADRNLFILSAAPFVHGWSTHMLLMQSWVSPQTMPHPPHELWLLVRSRHCPMHAVSFDAQQMPLLQAIPPPHELPQPPQLSLSVFASTHSEPQEIVSPVHCE
jgi:hypothetical protein